MKYNNARGAGGGVTVHGNKQCIGGARKKRGGGEAGGGGNGAHDK